MRLVNERVRAKDLVEQWVKQFGEDSPREVKILRSLPPDPSPDDVDEAFASFPTSRGRYNKVDRQITCDECGKDVVVAVEVGFYKSDESTEMGRQTCLICPECLFDAMKLMDGP